jgi:hypothetical protein
MAREYEQFVKDIDFIINHKDNWIFTPLYEIVRRLVILYEKFYSEEV